MKVQRKLKRIYRLLEAAFGDLNWWPAETDFEVAIGAILTQNTSWKNVEKAIESLKTERLMSPEKIAAVGEDKLSRTIRPAGYHRIKAARLKEMSRFILSECGGDMKKLRRRSTLKLREKLLEVKGVGPETADSILLYALQKPVFVVDSYTKRIFSRHGLIDEKASYDEVRFLVEENFTGDAGAFNQFHALLVETAKRFCLKRKTLCGKCPLKTLL